MTLEDFLNNRGITHQFYTQDHRYMVSVTAPTTVINQEVWSVSVKFLISRYYPKCKLIIDHVDQMIFDLGTVFDLITNVNEFDKDPWDPWDSGFIYAPYIPLNRTKE